MARKKKTRSRAGRKQALQHQQLDTILAGLVGEPDYTFDHQRPEERRGAPRVMSIAAHRELFNRLAARDYLYLRNLPIRTAAEVLPLLLPQSIWGRAQNGHGMFCDELGRPLLFPEITMEDVILALGTEELGIQERSIRHRRQELIAGLEHFLLEALATERITFGDPADPLRCPFGVTFLPGVTVDSAAFLKGFALGGMMDNWRQRRSCAEHFQVTLRGEPLILGGGESWLVDRERLQQVGLTEQMVASVVLPDQELDQLRELEVLVGERDQEQRKPQPVGMYFRRGLGPGVSDDAALIFIGKTHGADAMYGAFLADAADTYDKFLARYVWGGWDERLVRVVRERWQGTDELATEEEIRRVIYFSAKANHPALEVSSSHRRFIQVEPGARVPTFLNHLAFVRGEQPARIPLGYNRVDSDGFYQALHERAKTLKLGW